MTPLAVELARAHGGTAADWLRRLAVAGLPGDQPRARLNASQRRKLRELLAATEPTATEASTRAPPVPSWEAWARWALRAYLMRCEPWRLGGSSDARYEFQRWSEDTLLGTAEVTCPPEPPCPEAPPPGLLLDPVTWAAMPPRAQRIAALVAVVSDDLRLQRAIQPLVPGPRGHGWPRRLILRMAAGGERTDESTLVPPGIATRVYGAEERWSVAGPPRLQAPPQTSEDNVTLRHGTVVRLPPLPSDVPDLVLHPDTAAALRELSRRSDHAERVVALGFRQLRPGTLVLFAGEPGHGKRSAARRFVTSLGLELHQVRAGMLGSRYIGESEAMMSSVFAGLEPSTSAILIEDAQDLLSERTTVRDASDRYANMATNHLLQLLDDWAGLCIFTGPGLSAFDPAVRRRFAVIVGFPTLDGPMRTTLVGRWLDVMHTHDPAFVQVPRERHAAIADAAIGLAPGAIVRALFDIALDTPAGQVLDAERIIGMLRVASERRSGAVRRYA